MFTNLILTASQAGYVWLLISLIFLFVEISTPGLFFFITFSLGSVLAALAAFIGYSFVIQCFSLLFGFVVSFILVRIFFSKRESKRIPTNVNALVGKKGIVLKDIKKTSIGLVKVGGEVWSAQSLDKVDIDKDKEVEIVLVRGNRLIVKV